MNSNAPAEKVDVEHDGLDLVTVRVYTASGVVTYTRPERRARPRDPLAVTLDVRAMIRHVSQVLSACSLKHLLTGIGFQEVQS